MIKPTIPFVRHGLFAMALLLCTAVAAQEKKKPETKVILYKDRIAAQFDTVNCVKNVIKINPLLVFRGEAPIYYERALTANLSIEAALGVTFRDFLNFSINGDQPDDFGAGTELVPQLSYHFGFRYYFTNDLEPQGWYGQVEVAHLNYTKDIRTKDSTGTFTNLYLRDERIYNDVRLLCGYQMLSGTSNWLFDIYGGLGLRDRSMMKVNDDFTFSNGYEDHNYTVVEQSDVVLVPFLGFKFGYGF